MTKPVTFSEGAARRIADVVKDAEQGGNRRSRPNYNPAARSQAGDYVYGKITEVDPDSPFLYGVAEQYYNKDEEDFIDLPNGMSFSIAEGNPIISPLGVHRLDERVLLALSGMAWFIIPLPSLSTPFPVALTQTGGADGTGTTAATWTYTVTDIDGNELETGLQPTAEPHNWHREYGLTTAATKGTCYYKSDGAGGVTLVLHWLDESYTAEECA